MKYIPNTKLITGALLMCATLSAQAQKDSVQVAPDITYTADHPSYIIGGIQVEGADEFDREMLLNSSELNVGQTIEVPGPEISDAIRRYWKQGLYSDVKIEADSIVGNKVYLKIKLTSRPRISQIRYNGVKKSEREDIEAQLGIKRAARLLPTCSTAPKSSLNDTTKEKDSRMPKLKFCKQMMWPAKTRLS